jgi:hypothetical protein
MSLLQKASIITTPTAYAEDYLYSIKPAYALNEVVVNGTFDTDSDWGKSAGVTISNGKATVVVTGGGFQYINQNISYDLGATYRVKLTVQGLSGSSGKAIRFQDDGGNLGTLFQIKTLDETVQTFEVEWTPNSESEVIQIARSTSSGDYSFTVDNVSVKKITDADFDFDRNSTGTRVNEDYLIETVATNTPRIDYTNGEPSILLEPQRQNLVTHSEALITYWTLQGTSLIADNTAINPTGNTFANKLNSTNTSTFRSITRNESTAWDSKTLTMSCFAKKITNDYIFFYNIGSTSGINGLWFNISNGTIGTNGAAWANAKIENYGNGWYRCSAKITFGTSTNYLYINNSDGDNNTTSTVGSQTYIWGTQIEEGSYATSLIHTSGSAVTRSADAAYNAGNSDLISSTEGVLYVEASSNYDSSHTNRIAISDGTSSNRISLEWDETTQNRIRVHLNTHSLLNYDAVDLSIQNKVAVKYAANDYAIWFNGREVVTQASGALPTGMDMLELRGVGLGSAGSFYGKAKSVMVFKEALTDLELEKLTGYNNHELYMNYYNRLSYLGLAEEYNVESDINNYIL